MIESIQDLWILTRDGIVIFEHIVSEEISPDLFGAMISALNTFAVELSEGGISSFKLQNHQFILIKKEDLIFIAKTLQKYQADKVKDELNELAVRFFNMFPDISFSEWKGVHIEVFQKFKKELIN